MVLGATLFSSRREFAFWITLCVYILHVFSFNWWDDFFSKLSIDNHSYRLLQIWVQADSPKKPFATPIGASEEDFEIWASGIEKMLYQALRYPDVPFLYTLVLDQPTFYQHQERFETWVDRFDRKIEFVFFDSLLEPLPEYLQHYGQIQCQNGIAAACSDFLRIIGLPNQNYDYNIYMDIDTFIYKKQSAKNPYLFYSPFADTSVKLFGLDVDRPGLSHSAFTYVGTSLERNALQLNNDFIVDFQTNPKLWRFVQNLAFERLTDAAQLFEIMAERPNITSFEEYQTHLEKKLNYALTHSHSNTNPVPLVINTTGPAFWKDLYLRGLSSRYLLPMIPSKGHWMNHPSSVYGATSLDEIQLFIPNQEQALDLIALNFMAHDFFYFQQRKASWLALLSKDFKIRSNRLSAEHYQIGKDFFQSSFDWFEEIASYES